MLLCVSGAFGSGKSTLHRPLIKRLPGVVVYDMDELLEDGRLLSMPIATEDAAADWPAYNRLWSRLLQVPLRSGISTIFLTPCFPEEFETPEPAHWLLLDCADATRRLRLERRGWSRGQIDDAIDDAHRARLRIADVLSTDGEVESTADALAERFRAVRDRPDSGVGVDGSAR